MSGGIAAGQSLILESTCSENAVATWATSFTNAGSLTMTNADVSATVVKAGKAELTLTTGGKTYAVDVPPCTPIVAMNPGTRAEVKKGVKVSIRQAIQGTGGAFTANDITVITARNYPVR